MKHSLTPAPSSSPAASGSRATLAAVGLEQEAHEGAGTVTAVNMLTTTPSARLIANPITDCAPKLPPNQIRMNS